MTTPEQTDHPPASYLSLSVPASPNQLGLLRAMARTVVAQHALSMDALADLVLAVDEAAATLVSHARPTSTLVATFDLTTDRRRVRVILTTTLSSPLELTPASFSWLVLRTLVDHLALEQVLASEGNDDDRATITLDKVLQARS